MVVVMVGAAGCVNRLPSGFPSAGRRHAVAASAW
jgi:hypothetical protein